MNTTYKENVQEIKAFIDILEQFPDTLQLDGASVDYYQVAMDALLGGIKAADTDPAFEDNLDYWFGERKAQFRYSGTSILGDIGAVGSYEAAKKIVEINRAGERRYAAEVASFVLDGNESCLGAAMIYAMNGVADGEEFKNLARLWKKKPYARIEKISFVPFRFMTGYILFASQLF